MGAALDIDWPGLRAAAVALRNVRAAARQAAKDMKKDEQYSFIETVAKRAQREQWLPKAAAVVATAKAEPKALSGTVSCRVLSGSATLAGLEPDTRLKLAVAGNRTATHLSTLSGAELSKRTTDVLSATKASAIHHGWGNEQQQRGPLVSLNFVATQAAAEQVTIDLPSVEQSGPTE